MSVALKISNEGVLLPLRAQAGARRNGITGTHAGRLKIAVCQVPEKGKANHEILKLLADLLNLSKSQIRLIAGESSPQKTVCLSGVSLSEVERRLASLLAE